MGIFRLDMIGFIFIYSIKRFGLTVYFGIFLFFSYINVRKVAEILDFAWYYRTVDSVLLNFGDILGAGCWEYWWRAGTIGTKKNCDFFGMEILLDFWLFRSCLLSVGGAFDF